MKQILMLFIFTLSSMALANPEDCSVTAFYEGCAEWYPLNFKVEGACVGKSDHDKKQIVEEYKFCYHKLESSRKVKIKVWMKEVTEELKGLRKPRSEDERQAAFPALLDLKDCQTY